MKFKDIIFEATDIFPREENIIIDPARDGPYDIARDLLPALVKVAYASLWFKRNRHENLHGPKSDEPDAYNFDFTHQALEDEIETLIDHVGQSLKDLKAAEIKAEIKKSEKDFKEPLQKE